VQINQVRAGAFDPLGKQWLGIFSDGVWGAAGGIEVSAGFRKSLHYLWLCFAVNHPNAAGAVSKNSEAPVKLSARNALKGKITKVIKGATTSHVLIDMNGATITSSITNEAVEDLNLKEGMEAYAIIKSSDVMIGTL
jgi:molybdopterin-binding protein